MSAGKHTPAPLEVVRGDTYRAAIVHRTAKGKKVVLARVTVPRLGSSTEERQAIADANAAIFAAAPDMKEALERVNAAIVQSMFHLPTPDEVRDEAALNEGRCSAEGVVATRLRDVLPWVVAALEKARPE